jgi:microcystin-dependent protein
MPSTYSSSLRLELQATGENANTWGTKTNNNLNLLQQAIAGYVKITLVSASSTYTLDIADASASDGRNAFIKLAGTAASAISVVVPDVAKGYWVKNSATGSPLTFRTSGGTGFTLPSNEWVFVISDGTTAVNTTPTSLTGYARLAASQTFTGANVFASSVDITGPVSVSASAAFTRPVDIRATLSVTGSVTFTGAATFTSAVAVNAPLSVTGAAVFTSTVNVSKTLVVAATVESTLGGMKFPDGTLQSTAATTGDTIPAGSVMDYAGTAAPSGWLLCYGQAVSRTTYAALFTAISTTYGSGDGSTTFNLPDLRGRVAAGKDDMGGSAANRITAAGSGITGTTLGAAGGTQTHTLTEAQMPAHTHSGGFGSGSSVVSAMCGSGGNVNTGSTGGGAAHQNTQPTLILNKIIKT